MTEQSYINMTDDIKEIRLSFRNKCDECGKILREEEGVIIHYFGNKLIKRLCWSCYEKFCLNIIRYKLVAILRVHDGKIDVDYTLQND